MMRTSRELLHFLREGKKRYQNLLINRCRFDQMNVPLGEGGIYFCLINRCNFGEKMPCRGKILTLCWVEGFVSKNPKNGRVIPLPDWWALRDALKGPLFPPCAGVLWRRPLPVVCPGYEGPVGMIELNKLDKEEKNFHFSLAGGLPTIDSQTHEKRPNCRFSFLCHWRRGGPPSQRELNIGISKLSF